MTEQNLLDGTQDEPTIDESKNYLEEYVGPGRKFKDNEALAKGKAASDIHIANLERRIDQLREDYIKARETSVPGDKLQQFTDQLTALQQQLASRNNTPPNEVNNAPQYKPEEIQSLVSQEVAKLSATAREQDNYSKVLAKVEERFGSNYKSVLKDQASQLGLTDEDVNSMARRNPNLFFKTFDINQTAQGDNMFQTPPNSQQRSGNYIPKTEKKTLSYYENIRKSDPNKYYDKKTLVEMDRNAQLLGDAFFDL